MSIASVMGSIRCGSSLRLVFSAACAALMLSLATPAAAADWLCNLSEDVEHLVCLADIDLFDDPVTAGTAAAVPVMYRGNRYPLDKRKIYVIALWGPPSEMERLEQLAQSAICFRSPACTVTLSPVSWTIAGIPRVRTFIQR